MLGKALKSSPYLCLESLSASQTFYSKGLMIINYCDYVTTRSASKINMCDYVGYKLTTFHE